MKLSKSFIALWLLITAMAAVSNIVLTIERRQLWHDNAQCEGRMDEAEDILKAHNWHD